MKKILLIIFLCFSYSALFPQAEFKVSVEDCLFSGPSDNFVYFTIYLKVKNIGDEIGKCEEIYGLNLECSQEYIDFNRDIIFDELTGDLTINILPEEEAYGSISFIVPKDADNLTLKFSEETGGASKFISDSFNKWMRDNTDPYYYIDAASDSFSEGKYLRTVIYCLKALTIDPDIDVSFQIANAAVMLGYYDLAIEYYEIYLEDNPRNPIALNNIGWSYFEKGYYDEATEYFSDAYYYDTEHWDAVLGAAISYLKQDDFQTAEDLYNLAASIQPLLYRGMDGLEKLIEDEGYFYTDNQISAINTLFSISRYKNETVNPTFPASGRLYFCEDYMDESEIGVSDTFTPGWLTVMVQMDNPFGVNKVELRIVKIMNNGTEKIIDTIPFDVQADWDYCYFQDQDKVGFYTPGYYKVTLQKVDGTPIVSGNVTIVER